MNEHEQNQPVDIEVIPTITDEALKIVNDFIDQENQSKNLDVPTLDTKSEKLERLNHNLLISQAKLVIKEIIDKGDLNNSFLCIAVRDNQVVGISLAGLDKNQNSVGFYTGVAWKNRRQGISTQLVRQRLEELKKRGVSEYQAEMWEGSLGVSQKLAEEGLIDIIPRPEVVNSYTIKIRNQTS